MFSRRDLLVRSLRSSALVPLAPAVPVFLSRSLSATERGANTERILVVIELDGGNDGINTVVPFADDGYLRYRRRLRLPIDRLIKVNDDLGLHPSLKAMAKLWEQGWLSIVQGVGYPNPNRSHFKSMAIWQSARLEQNEQTGHGWVGRGLDGAGSQPNGPVAMSVGPQVMPVALRGRRAQASSIYRLEQFDLGSQRGTVVVPPKGAAPQSDLHQFVFRTATNTARTVEQLRLLGKTDSHAERYPSTSLADRLRLTARLIRADLGIRAFYTQQSGYDTHAGQLPRQASLLGELSGALSAFFADLQAAGLAERVVVLAFSEFGRRVQENESHGTDHGTAGPVLLLGPSLQGGIVGETPSLLDLEYGDLKMSFDFRSVYATVLEEWLSVSSEAALGGDFIHVPLFQRS